MGRILSILAMVLASFSGHFLYQQYKMTECLDGVDRFKTTFEQRSSRASDPAFQRGMSTAIDHCKNKEFGMARNVVNGWSLGCRTSRTC